MTEPLQRPSEETLHAHVDGFLNEDERAAVERFLAENPAEALRLDAYRQQNIALQTLRTLPEARPFTLPEFRRRVHWGRMHWGHMGLRVAASIALLLLGGSGGYVLHSQLKQPAPAWMQLVEQAELAHVTFVPEVVHPVEVVREQGQHLRTWLSKRLGVPVTVPVLAAHGYDLIGGRLLPANPGPAAQFMYQDVGGNRITLYVLAAPAQHRDTAFRYVQSGSLWICYWTGEAMDFALTGELTREQIPQLAKSVFMQLNKMNPPTMSGW